MTTIQELEFKINQLERRINAFDLPDKYLFKKDIEMFNGKNMRFSNNTTNGQGTQIGGLNGQLSFYDANPLPKQTGVTSSGVDLQNALINLGLISP